MKRCDWVTELIEDTARGRRFKRRIQRGIDHLEGKKLYKYYSFSSPYTVSNLKNDTIYLQNPVLFNDPFDCNIGISVNQLVRAFVPSFFDKYLPNSSDELRSILCAWLLGDPVPDLEKDSVAHLLSICANNPGFVKLANMSKNGVAVSDQEALLLLLDDPQTLSEIIHAYLRANTNETAPSIDDVTMQQVIKYPQLIKGLLLGCGEEVESKEMQLLNLLSSDGDFFTKIEALASFAGMDIPTLEIEKVYMALDSGISQLRSELGKRIGVECFTQSPTDVLMWSYYAEKHTGICVEYDFSKMFSSLPDAFLLPVHYSEKRPLLNLEKIYNPVTKQFYKNEVAKEFPSIMRSLITKSLEWDREKEWRLISFSIDHASARAVRLPIISKIITGINISDENYKIVSQIANDKGIPIQRTRLKNDQYKIDVLSDDIAL